MDIVSGLPRTHQGHDSILVKMDRLTKSAYFIPVRTIHTIDKLAELYIQDIVRLYGIPYSIIFDEDSRFTSRFWKSIQLAHRTKLKFSTAYHP